MDVVFFGSGAFGLPTLKALERAHNVRAVVTQPDRKAGRGGRLSPTPIGEFAADALPRATLIKPENVNVDDVRNSIREIGADAWVVIAFGQKMSGDLLEEVFAINLHASLLPRWRGAAPINAAILAGDNSTGNSVITLADRMDAGLVLGQSDRSIEPNFTAGQLHELLAEDGPSLVLDVLGQHASDQVQSCVQDESKVTVASKLRKADGWIDFSSSADSCRCRINGLSPWPGVTARFRGEPLKLLRAECVESDSESKVGAGVIVDKERGIVGCGKGLVRFLEVQPPGKRAMPWDAFARGRAVDQGELIESSNQT